MKNLPIKESMKTIYRCVCRRYCTEGKELSKTTDLSAKALRTHAARINKFFRSAPHLQEIKKYIPEKYFAIKKKTPPDNLYLVDETVAKKVSSYILPVVKDNKKQILCETSAGLGLIATELLENGIELVRLYESCPDFKEGLTEFDAYFKGRIEIFSKNIFHLPRYHYMDKQDHGNRVEQLLKGLPKKSWVDDPAMTIIGAIPNTYFIRFLTKCLVLQNDVIANGRIDLFVFMKPRDYVILSAGPHLNLHTYQCWSVIFNLLYDYELLDKFSRKCFLPWESEKHRKLLRYPTQIDPDQIYLVRISLKKELPVTIENLLPLYSFITQFFGKGTNKIVPILEKWVPGSGLDAMVPKAKYTDYFKDLNIFTKFGELSPTQILYVFQEMITNSEYSKSPFMAMVENQLIKTETIESALDEHLEKTIVDDLESKLD